MPIWLTTVDGKEERVRNQRDADDETTLDHIVRGAGHPYAAGWIEIDSPNAKYVALRHVVAFEIRRRAERT